MCRIPPHPDLAEKLRQELAALQNSHHGLGRIKASFEPSEKPGFNDGLIIPGSQYVAGTSLQRMRRQALERAPLRGTVRVVVILVDFPDLSMTATQAHFEELFFSTGTLATGSVREYFQEVSGGLVDVVGEVVGVYRLPQNLAQYAHGDSGTGSVLPNARTMARDAAVAANPDVDFSIYDNDGNGYVDAFIVVHAGPGAEVTGSTGDIWSHKWVLSGGEYNADGTKIYSYLTVPEDCRLGVCAHELGHLLFGWPDLYDTDGSSEGLGNWCLMAGGSWNNGGLTPAHPSAWCKVNQGWVSVINQTANQTETIHDVKTNRTVYRLWKNGGSGSEYFLAENRQRTLFDAHLPSDGLLIFHVDESISGNSNEAHPQVALEQADGLNQLGTGVNRGDAGDPFPGSSGNRTFNASSNPNSKSYGGVDTCVSVTNISASGPSMTARLAVSCKLKEKEKEKEKEIRYEKARFKELFEKRQIKDVDKPLTDKAVAYDKGFDDFGRDWFNRWVGLAAAAQSGQGPQTPAAGGQQESCTSLEQRIAALEAAVGVEPFIGNELRPDLAQGALLAEEDLAEIQARMAQGVAGAKQSFDTKASDR